MDPHRSHDPVPTGIRWSAATSAFQIEGARDTDGRGRSIWDDFVDRPGAVIDGSDADPGPDSYHRFADDVALAGALGIDRYRFSISWVRVLPDGVGAASRAGLDLYSRLVDALLDAGVTPFPTLYHWDLPVGIEAVGGWLNRDTVERFRDYAAVVADSLGDRVRHWYTVNEPAMTTLQGYGIGTLAPGRQELFGALPTVHHQLLAHGEAMAVLRDAGAAQVGIVNNHTHVLPLSSDPADLRAASVYDLLHNRLFSDPILTGEYPAIDQFGLPPLPIRDGDLATISVRPDFYGVNFYNPTTVRAAEAGPLPFEIVPTPGVAHTGFGAEWAIMPQALAAVLVGLRARYGHRLPPIIIAENGASFPEPSDAARIDDHDRIDYLRGHISAVAEAIAAGVDVEEYTVWSLLDNFEWADGFTQRFGLVHVDMRTGERTPKASYDWYRDLIAGQRAGATDAADA